MTSDNAEVMTTVDVDEITKMMLKL